MLANMQYAAQSVDVVEQLAVLFCVAIALVAAGAAVMATRSAIEHRRGNHDAMTHYASRANLLGSLAFLVPALKVVSVAADGLWSPETSVLIPMLLVGAAVLLAVMGAAVYAIITGMAGRLLVDRLPRRFGSCA